MAMKKLPVPEIVVVSVVLLLGAGIFWWAHRDQSDLEQSKERGAAVVAGLEAYHAQHGTYPETLAMSWCRTTRRASRSRTGGWPGGGTGASPPRM
jgi:hypothetical protein